MTEEESLKALEPLNHYMNAISVYAWKCFREHENKIEIINEYRILYTDINLKALKIDRSPDSCYSYFDANLNINDVFTKFMNNEVIDEFYLKFIDRRVNLYKVQDYFSSKLFKIK